MDALLPASEPMAADPIPATTSIMADYDMGEGEAEDHAMMDEGAQQALQDEGMLDEEYAEEGAMEHDTEAVHEAGMDDPAHEEGEGGEHDMADQGQEHETAEVLPQAEEAPSYESVAVTASESGDVPDGQAQREASGAALPPLTHRKSLADAPPLGTSAVEIPAEGAAASSGAVDAAEEEEVIDTAAEAYRAEEPQSGEAVEPAGAASGAAVEPKVEGSTSASEELKAEAHKHAEAAAVDDQDEGEPAVPACRLTFDEQDFVIFPSSSVPSYTVYSADQEGAEPLVVEAPPLAVPVDVFDKPLDELFKAFRVKDSLGDFLQEGTELEVLLPELDLAIREDDRNARDVKLSDLYSLHKGLGLEISLHLVVSEAGDRFISRFHALAAQVESNASVSGELPEHGAAEGAASGVDTGVGAQETQAEAATAEVAEGAEKPAETETDTVHREALEDATHEEEQTFVTVQEEEAEEAEEEEHEEQDAEAEAEAEAEETAEGVQEEDEEGAWQEEGEEDELPDPEGEGEGEDQGEDAEGEQEGEYEAYQPDDGDEEEEQQQEEEDVHEEGVDEPVADEQLVDYEEAVPEGEDAEAEVEDTDPAHSNGAEPVMAVTSTKRPLEEDNEDADFEGEAVAESNGTEEADSKRVKVA